MTGVAFAVIDDRERYRMLKYVYVAPVDFRLYLIGRAAARVATGSISVLVTLVLGVLVLRLPLDAGTVRWPLFVVSFGLGIVMLGLLGLWLGGFVMRIAHQSWSVGEAVAGTLFLFSGAVFPLEVLPGWLQTLGYILPLTYWLELMRRSLLGRSGFDTFAGYGDLQLLGLLALLTAAASAAALTSFARCEHAARERGLIDRTTGY
jgi:ABC-2 type transport system permease protein